MIYTKDEEVIELIKKFEDSAVTATEWTHGAHLTVALFYAVNHDFETALGKMRAGIFKLNAAHGTPNTPTRGYHETLTVFWLLTISEFLEKTKERDSLSKLANHLIETCGDSGLPLKFYSRDVLFSPAARANYIEPNL
ncbi:MAG: hypothetical protein ABI954_06495 [Pyrinomonadaceae bacterium]